LFREFAASLPDIQFVTDDHGLNPQFNPRWHEYTGLPEHCSRDPHLNEAVHPADRQRVLDSWHLAVASGSPFEARYRLRSADGRHRWFIVRARPVAQAGGAPRWFRRRYGYRRPDARRGGAARPRRTAASCARINRPRDLRDRILDASHGLVRSLPFDMGCSHPTRCSPSPRCGARYTRRTGAHVIAGINRSRDPRGTGEFAFEARILGSNGHERLVAARGRSFFTPTADGERAIRCIGTMLDITERRAAQERLLRSEQRLELAQEAADVGMWDYDLPSNTLALVAHPLSHVWPIARRRSGKYVAVVLGIRSSLRTASVCRRKSMRRCAAERITRPSTGFAVATTRSAGSPAAAASSEMPKVALGRFIGVSLDITDAKAAQQRLAQSEELFRLAAEAVNGIIYDLDPASGRVRRTRGLFEIAGYQRLRGACHTQWWVGLMHPEDREQAQQALAYGLETGVMRLEANTASAISRDTGSMSWTAATWCATAPGGGAHHRLHPGRDQLRAAERSLRETDRRKDEFLAVLAHELRNPLAPISSALAIMRRAPVGAEAVVSQARDMMDRQVAHMVRLIDDLLDVGRITSGKLALRREIVSLRTVVDTALDSARPLLESERHQLVGHAARTAARALLRRRPLEPGAGQSVDQCSEIHACGRARGTTGRNRRAERRDPRQRQRHRNCPASDLHSVRHVFADRSAAR
jgi:PAS domain S-box-containing protein